MTRNIAVKIVWRDDTSSTHWVRIPFYTKSADIAARAVKAGFARFADRRDYSDRPRAVSLHFVPTN
jgi:hypothetical protein